MKKTKLEKDVTELKKDLVTLRKKILNNDRKIEEHLKKQRIEIRVKEQDGNWGDFSGIFFLTEEEMHKGALKKTKEHFDRIFYSSFPNKEFAIYDCTNKVILKIIKT